MCARYLRDCKDAHRTKWAAAGRDEAKIAATLNDLGAKDVPILVADSHDERALTIMLKKTRCVISTAVRECQRSWRIGHPKRNLVLM